MGFCIYCNLKVTGTTTTCPKCYRTIALTKDKPVDTKASTAMFSIPRKSNQSNIDKWQDTYSKKAIFSSGISSSTSTPLKARQQRPMPTFSKKDSTTSRLTKTCANCQKPQTSWKDLSIYNSAYYCKPCLSEVLACPGCKESVEQGQIQTYFNKKTWHAACLRCASCGSPLKAMLATVDNNGNPSCRVCRTKIEESLKPFGDQFPPPQSTSASTPLLHSTASPSKASQSSVDKIPPIKPRRSSAAYVPFNSKEASKDLSDGNDIQDTPPVTAAPETLKKADEFTSPRTGTNKEETPAKEPTPTTSTAPRRKKVVKKPCRECGLHVSRKDYRGLKIHTGETLVFHSYCLFCAKCHQPFNTLEFCTDGMNFYHMQCPPSLAIPSRNDTPLSEEDEAYPRTPPSDQAYFNIAAQSPTTNTMSPSSLQPEFTPDGPQEKKEDGSITKNEVQQEPVVIICNACSLPVTDTCLELANQIYHKECLLCAGCNKTVPTDKKLIKYQNRLYCDICSMNLIDKQQKRSLSNNLKVNTQSTEHGFTEKEKNEQIEVPKRNTSVTSPSDIFKTRKKVLPRLGGVRTCARCNQSMPFSDTQPGPNASRWHKKCLRCAGCNKQMDSDAHMTVNEETGLCLVHCRDCLDDTPKPRFVRR
ncbi:hypothetical protein BDF20DRAFT_872559 [Mycotypha africana]|uniref:uncharacterized protein n=1 Tax=Mycotypha africana TaxID=64632 RepID=UPI0023001B14|nr:uncharacterized protein BDF20DRAFT_872559 [Mycotypha africana]KAI8977038.1 hypothetical protein BDF20DRAFT_872559 [Mycotypha africana]